MNPLRSAWNSLHARLLVGAALWIVAALAMSDFAISALFRQYVTGQFLHELVDHAMELQGLAHQEADGRIQLIRPLSDPRFSAPGSGFYWEINRDGKPLLKSESLGQDALQLASGLAPLDPHPTQLSRGSAPILVVERDFAVSGHPLRLAVGADAAQLEAILDRFGGLLRLSLGVLAIGLCAAAAAQVAFGLRPVHRLRRMLDQVRTGRTEKLPEDFPTEVRPLVDDLNSLIAANAEMVQRARAQAGNLAHALKGPLAILIDEARQLEAEGSYRAAAVVLQQCAAMGRQIDHQLARTRAAAVQGGHAARTSPYAAAGTILSAMTRLHADKSLVFENDVASGLELACDEDDLHEIMGNLIDNAAKWAVERVRVSSAVAPDERTARIVIEDDGPGIRSENYETVFGVGERLDEQKPGSGLGLAIVRDLTKLYGGDARLGRSPLGGLRAEIELPRAA